MGWQKGCQTTLRSDNLGDSKNFTIVRSKNPVLEFPGHSKNVTISSELLWPAAPPCPAGLVLVFFEKFSFSTFEKYTLLLAATSGKKYSTLKMKK